MSWKPRNCARSSKSTVVFAVQGRAKTSHIIKKADIRAGHRVLEIGSGWGSFAIEVSPLAGVSETS